MQTLQERSSPLHARRRQAGGTQAVRLRNWPVRSKLIAVLAIPALALLVLASINVTASLDSAKSLRRGGSLARLERQITALTHELELERDLTMGVLPAGRGAGASLLRAQQASVDRAAAAYRAATADPYRAASPAVRAQLDGVRAGLGNLDALRNAIAHGGLTQEAVSGEYSRLISGLQEVDLQAALRSGDEQLAQQVRAFTDLARTKELTSQVRGMLYAIATSGQFGFGQFQDFADLLAQQRAALDQFLADADEQQRGLFTGFVRGPAVLAVLRIQQAAVHRQARPQLGLNPQQWLAASTTEIELQRTVEAQLLETVIQRGESLSGAAQLRSLRDSLLIALSLAVALLGALTVARSMVRPLQRLRRGVLEVAEQRLPDAVRRTEAGEVDVGVATLGDLSRDEIGEVARAFDQVHLRAVELATEQAGLRRSISDMFLNLARRSQTLIDRLIEGLDDLEREADADTLEKLFSVDHLATRLRRHAESLIVLSGTPDPPRRWQQAIPLVDVVRAAVQEVEDYQRVELVPMDEISLAGYAVSEVVHLLAELIENATRFSPPAAIVRIGGQPTGSGHVIEIEDRGLGMSDTELQAANQRLAHPPAVDAAVGKQLGLAVIGRLAKRHDIHVQLRHSFYGGITALVLLPSRLATGAVVPEPPPSSRVDLPALTVGGGGPERQPVFEQARSGWFQPSAGAAPRRHANAHAGHPTQGHPSPTRPTPTVAQPSPAPPQAPSPPPPAPPQAGPPPHAAAAPADPAASTPPGGSPPAGASWHADGLPRRTPRANLAAGLGAAPPQRTPPSAGLRSPEEIRAMLSRYRSGIERGRRMAAAPPSEPSPSPEPPQRPEPPRRPEPPFPDPRRGQPWDPS